MSYIDSIQSSLKMTPEEFRDSKRLIPQNFEFDEDFDEDCFDEQIQQRDPPSLKIQSSLLLESKKSEIAKDIIKVLNRHGLKYDVSDDRDFNSLIKRILVTNSNDPSVAKFL